MSRVSHADLGGQPGHGRVVPEPEGELWHEPFEPKALALTVAMGATGAWSLDETRAVRETLPGYLGLSYYRIWIAALERQLAALGLAGADELAAGRLLHAPKPLPRRLAAADVAAVLARGSSTERPATTVARFAVGDRVRTRPDAADHHTRLPGYARGRRGVVERVHGVHVFADSHAQRLGESPQWLYAVGFDGAELWGADATPGLRVTIDAWEPYLDADDGADNGPADPPAGGASA